MAHGLVPHLLGDAELTVVTGMEMVNQLDLQWHSNFVLPCECNALILSVKKV